MVLPVERKARQFMVSKWFLLLAPFRKPMQQGVVYWHPNNSLIDEENIGKQNLGYCLHAIKQLQMLLNCNLGNGM